MQPPASLSHYEADVMQDKDKSRNSANAAWNHETTTGSAGVVRQMCQTLGTKKSQVFNPDEASVQGTLPACQCIPR